MDQPHIIKPNTGLTVRHTQHPCPHVLSSHISREACSETDRGRLTILLIRMCLEESLGKTVPAEER